MINTTSSIRIYVGDVNLSDYLIDGAVSDSSVYSSNIVTTSGSLNFFAGEGGQYLDFNKTIFPIGSQVKIWVGLDNGRYALHPRGTLFVIDSSINLEERTLTLEVGCSLAYLSDKESLYGNAVNNLFKLVQGESTSSFKVDDLTLGNLSTLLEASSLCIYQDQYGNIQKLPSFGNDGIGSQIVGPKFTSFDRHTAISIESISESAPENAISRLTVTASVEVPIVEEQPPADEPEPEPDPDEQEENDVTDKEGATTSQPPPFVQTATERTASYPYLTWRSMRSPGGIFYIDIAEEENPETAASPCILPPGAEEPVENPNSVALKCYGDIFVKDRQFTEKVLSGGSVEYEGFGNQVSYEESWEYCSGATFASSLLSTFSSAVESACNDAVSNSNSALSKANQHLQALENVQVGTPKYFYHICNVNSYSSFAEAFSRVASAIFSYAGNVIGGANAYSVSNCTQTYYTYDRNGVLTKKVVDTYKNFSTTKKAEDLARQFGFVVANEEVNATSPLDTVEGPSLSGTTGGFPFPQTKQAPSQQIKTRTSSYDLVLVARSEITYEYTDKYDIEHEKFTDYEDPSNSYKRKNYSNAGNRASGYSDRIEEKETGLNAVQEKTPSAADDPFDYFNQMDSTQDEAEGIGEKQCTVESETRELAITVSSGLPAPSYGSAGWFGSATLPTKIVSLPSELAPVYPEYDEETDTCNPISAIGRIARYQAAMYQYAVNELKKIKGDSSGFRVVEKLRAELFEYYPFYPILVSVETLGKAFACRSAAATWAFDSTNAICSFDCFAVSEVAQPSFCEPSKPLRCIKTDAPLVLTADMIGIPDNADKIKMDSLPDQGAILLDGIPVVLNQEILVADIDAGLLVLNP